MWVTLKDDASLRWRILLALLVGTFLAGMILSLVLAAQRVTKVVDRDYYRKGLNYGRTVSGSVNPGLGWSISASLAGNDLQVKVLDQSGAPVPGGRLRFEPEQSGQHPPAPLQLAEVSPGTFLAPRPQSHSGELHGILHFTCGEAFATRKLVLFN